MSSHVFGKVAVKLTLAACVMMLGFTFIARWPGKIKPGTVNDALIEYVDVLPTYIEAAGGTPPSALDGQSLLPVLLRKAKEHNEYVIGEMTTRGIINGSEHFGIRSIRSRRFKYVWNFTSETKFQNACTKSSIFKSWRDKAASNSDAAGKVRRHEHRPVEELYDIIEDQYEWNNLADDPKYAKVKAESHRRLLQWMKAMGNKGQQTEMEAFGHQVKNRNRKTQGAGRNRAKKPEKGSPNRSAATSKNSASYALILMIRSSLLVCKTCSCHRNYVNQLKY
jgi:uncharacterized sulfatase